MRRRSVAAGLAAAAITVLAVFLAAAPAVIIWPPPPPTSTTSTFTTPTVSTLPLPHITPHPTVTPPPPVCENLSLTPGQPFILIINAQLLPGRLAMYCFPENSTVIIDVPSNYDVYNLTLPVNYTAYGPGTVKLVAYVTHVNLVSVPLPAPPAPLPIYPPALTMPFGIALYGQLNVNGTLTPPVLMITYYSPTFPGLLVRTGYHQFPTANLTQQALYIVRPRLAWDIYGTGTINITVDLVYG